MTSLYKQRFLSYLDNIFVVRLKEEIEDVRRVLEAKEHNLSESRRIASEKDQVCSLLASCLGKNVLLCQ